MEEYSEPETNVIESSIGFSVRVLGRTGLRYVEGHRSVCIDSEVLAKPRAIALFKDSIRAWEGPDGPEQLNDEDRDSSRFMQILTGCDYPELRARPPFLWSGAIHWWPVLGIGAWSQTLGLQHQVMAGPDNIDPAGRTQSSVARRCHDGTGTAGPARGSLGAWAR